MNVIDILKSKDCFLKTQILIIAVCVTVFVQSKHTDIYVQYDDYSIC